MSYFKELQQSLMIFRHNCSIYSNECFNIYEKLEEKKQGNFNDI